MSWVRPLFLAVLTGLLYPLCFPDLDQGWLAFVVLVPLHLALWTSSPGRGFWIGWLAGFVGFAGTMAWVVTAMHVYGKMPLVLAYPVMLLLAAYLGLYVALYGLLVAWLRRRLPLMGGLAAPCLWVALEVVRTYAFSGLPWGLLGYSQYRWLTAIQIADLTGVYGVSFYLVLVNVAVSELLAGRRLLLGAGAPALDEPASPALLGVRLAVWLAVAPAGLAMLAILAYGSARLASLQAPSPDVAVAVVQPNIDQAHKWDGAFRRETMDRYTRLTTQVGQRADLIVWPEAATPFLFEQELGYRLELATLVHRQGAPLLFGSPALRYYPNGRPYLLNSAYLFSSQGEIVGRYDKQHLVPFGEYIPLRRLLFFLDKLVEGIGDFEAGTVPTILALPDGTRETPPFRFGVVICFEVIFPNLVREFVRDGADFMVTITNDAWFGRSAAPYQHFGMVVFRAVENHVAFARAANTGISGFIDRRGAILEATPIFAEAAARRSLPLADGPTFYSRHGDLFAYGCVIIGGIFLASAARPRRRYEAIRARR